jgi:hypothetical protein
MYTVIQGAREFHKDYCWLAAANTDTVLPDEQRFSRHSKLFADSGARPLSCDEHCEAHLGDERSPAAGPSMAWSCAATSASTRTAISYSICRASPESAMRSGRRCSRPGRPAGRSSALHSPRCCSISRHFPVSFSPGPALPPNPRPTYACRSRQPLIPSEQLACIAHRYSCGLCARLPPPSSSHGWIMGSSPPGLSSIQPRPRRLSLRGTGGVSGGIYSGSLPARRRSRLQMRCPLEDDLPSCSSNRGSHWAVTVPVQTLYDHPLCRDAHLLELICLPCRRRATSGAAGLRRRTVRAPSSPCTPTPCVSTRLPSIGAQCVRSVLPVFLKLKT